MPREMPVISAEEVLELGPSNVKVFWATSIPSTPGLRECEVRIAKEAAAEAGFDLVTITYVPLIELHPPGVGLAVSRS